MSVILGIFVIVVFVSIYVIGNSMNDKIKIDCNKNEYCDGCSVNSCYHKKEEE